MKRIALLAIAVLVALAVSACASTDKIADCRHHGGLRQLRVQSTNANIVICGDGTVWRYDTGGGS